MATVYIQKEQVDHVTLTNDTGAALEQYELTVIGGLVVIADEAIASGAEGSFHCESGIEVQIADFVASEDTFGTANAPVYFDPTSGDFSDTATEGYYKVGIVQTVKDSNSVVIMSALREAVSLEVVINPGETGWLEIDVTADATTALSTDFGFNFTILDALVHSTATNASATLKLQDSSDNDISDAIVATPVLTVTRVGTIDGATNGYNVIADGVVKVIANGAADRGTVRMLVEAA